MFILFSFLLVTVGFFIWAQIIYLLPYNITWAILFATFYPCLTTISTKWDTNTAISLFVPEGMSIGQSVVWCTSEFYNKAYAILVLQFATGNVCWMWMNKIIGNKTEESNFCLFIWNRNCFQNSNYFEFLNR